MPYRILCNGTFQKSQEARSGMDLASSRYTSLHNNRYGVQECLLVLRPQTLEQVREANQAFVEHYNQERPNQALSCGNQPPRVAFPVLPTLPPFPGFVDPDAWLRQIDGAHFIRKVRSSGS